MEAESKAEPETKEFLPELISRRGEAFAWLAALLVTAAWLSLLRSGLGVNLTVPLLGIPLFLVALSISLGNWVNRKTILRLHPTSVEFQNGLRHVRLNWDEIQQVQVLPAHWGRRVQVIGENAHFDFLTLGEVKLHGEIKGRVGFVAGESILAHILDGSRLQKTCVPNQTLPSSGYYYARK
ncbi:MAG TPA: hypothetical protein VJ436_07230 [Anaerolineales bacterium]|nr:hypothetical protein [Anaerolineales bacterium]